jgi:hypothetical protein
MTFLSAAQKAAIRVVGKKPNAFFSATDTFSLEICDLANEVADDVMKAHDWRALTKLNVITGDGTTTSFPLPSDYDRMPIKAGVFRPDWSTWQYTPAQDLDQWQDILNGAPTISPGYWIILGGAMQFQPAISVGSSAQFYYITKEVVRANDDDLKTAFTKDDDSFVLDEGLLTLGLVWRWRAQKRLEYAEDLANYEKSLAEITGRDKGARILAEGRRTINADVGYAYPWALGI